MAQPDERPYGMELARQVGTRLFRGFALVDAHRDYCGVGLFHDDKGAFAAEVHEGRAGLDFARWSSLEEFARFFAIQTDRSPGSAAEFETEDEWRHRNQTLTRLRLEAFVTEVDGGEGQRSSHYVVEGPWAVLVLEEVLDCTALLRFLREELGYQLKEAHGMLKDLPARVFGVEDAETGEEWTKRFAEAGGRCAVRAEKA